jgi:hypothetical protein
VDAEAFMMSALENGNGGGEGSGVDAPSHFREVASLKEHSHKASRFAATRL